MAEEIIHKFFKGDLFCASMLVGFGFALGVIGGCCMTFTIAKLILWAVG